MSKGLHHDESPLIEIRNLVNAFGSLRVHEDLCMDVYRGEVLGIVGGSGSGKSVLLRSILGLRRPTAGTIRLDNLEVTALRSSELALARRRWGVLFQNNALFTSLTVLQNIQLQLLEFTSISESLSRELAEMKVAMVGLPAVAADKYPAQLSGGMRKRAALARALAMDPEILFLDEPTAGLDPISAARIDELVLHLKSELPLTIVMVTHDLDTLNVTCDRVGALVDGRIHVDTLANLSGYEHPWIQEFFNGPRARIRSTH